MATVVGLLGATGLYDEASFGKGEHQLVETPYGVPSDLVTVGSYRGLRVVLLPRHARDYVIPPHRLNHRANLWALHELGADVVFAASSVGSLKPTIRPGTFVVPHDYLSPWSIPTIHDEGVVHVTPELDEGLRKLLVASARKAGVAVRARGVYVQALGPRLETKAEIAMFAKFGDVVGMTMASEATIAREVGVRYASLCSVDNFAHGISGGPVSFEAIHETQRKNEDHIRAIVQAALEGLA